MTTISCDFLIIGGGIAGASIGYELSQHGNVIILERESRPDYHSSGRSSATFVGTYGNDVVRALNAGTFPFLEEPPDGFADRPLLSDRGCLHVASVEQLPLLEQLLETMGKLSDTLRRLDPVDIFELVPIMDPDVIAGAVLEPDAMDLDVNALHQGFLRGCADRGGSLQLNAEVMTLARRDGVWRAETSAGTYTAPVVVNAAGAWTDSVAQLASIPPLGMIPKRRTVFTYQPPREIDCSSWPLVLDAEEQFYFKPSGGFLLVTPADETPCEPSDVQPEEIDIAIAVDRFQSHTCLSIDRIEYKWAGLRTFSPDMTPVVGMDDRAEGLFWLAGQGGYGFQTSYAMARAASGLLTNDKVPADLIKLGVDRNRLSPNRFCT